MNTLNVNKVGMLVSKHGNVLLSDENLARIMDRKGYKVTPKYEYGTFVDACDRCLRTKNLIGYLVGAKSN